MENPSGIGIAYFAGDATEKRGKIFPRRGLGTDWKQESVSIGEMESVLSRFEVSKCFHCSLIPLLGSVLTK